MALQIGNQGPPLEVVVEQLRGAIAAAIADAKITIQPRGPGHFEISVVSNEKAGTREVVW